MRAAILQEPKKFIIQDLPIPTMRDDEILVRVKTCGICTGELDQWAGNAPGLEYPRFIGHEPSGIVEEVGRDVTTIKAGDRVTLWSEGKSYAELYVSPERYACKISDAVSFEHALGEPIACSVNGVRKTDPQLNDSVCLVGCGFMGLIMLQVFKARGAGLLIAIDARDGILELAQRLGATHTFNPKRTDVRKAVKDLTGGRGADIGVETGGTQQTLDLVGDLVRMEGKLEVFGFHQGAPRQVNWGYWNWMAFQIVNGHTRSPHIYVEGMRLGIGLLESGKLNMAPLVTHSFPLEEINRGFEVAIAKQEGFVKGIVSMAL